MITIRSANQRGITTTDWLTSYHSFSFGNYYSTKHHNFSHLRVINEDFIQAAGGFPPHSHNDMEIMTYMISGELAHQDSLNNNYTIKSGEIQFMRAGSGITHSEFNPSNKYSAHLLQIWITPQEKGLTPTYDQCLYTYQDKQNRLCKIADSKGSNGCFKIAQNVAIYCCILNSPTAPVQYLTETTHNLWVQVLNGTITINNNIQLNQGDGAAIQLEPQLMITAALEAELLLFDFAK